MHQIVSLDKLHCTLTNNWYSHLRKLIKRSSIYLIPYGRVRRFLPAVKWKVNEWIIDFVNGFKNWEGGKFNARIHSRRKMFLTTCSIISVFCSFRLFSHSSRFVCFYFSVHTLTFSHTSNSETKRGLELCSNEKNKIKVDESPFVVSRKNGLQMWDDEICFSIKRMFHLFFLCVFPRMSMS